MQFAHKKSLGQHFLNNALVPQWMCDAAEVTDRDLVVEIGPGTGVLTRELLGRGASVIALEADRRAVTILEEQFHDEITTGQLQVQHTDARQWNPEWFHLQNQQFKVVANIPYYLSGLLFRTFLEHAIQPNCLVFLVQKEVAKRATDNIARGGKESLLALSIELYGEPTYVRTVPRGHFTPPPKIDSAIMAVRNISRKRLDGVDEALFFTIIHLGFAQKRKQLLGNLAAKYDRAVLTHIFSTLGIDPTIRAEDVDLNTWLTLVTELAKHT